MAWVRLAGELEKHTFSFRGIFSARMKPIRYSPAASAQGSTSKYSPSSRPDRGEHITFRGKSPPPPMVTMPWSRAPSMMAHTASGPRSWSWMV